MSYPVIKHSEVITQDTRSTISARYRTVTKAINSEFRGIQSDTQYSLYVGSYGRGTAIDTSDLDILVELPEAEYSRYDAYRSNGQSRLLQAVKNAITNAYPRSQVKADGQVVKIDFSDGMQFEILPAFPNVYWFGQENGTYKYPDTNMGGNWRSTNPKAEQNAMKQKNNSSNGLLYDTCKHIRRVHDDYYSSYHLSGIVIDSFVYAAIGDWHWPREGESSTSSTGSYESVLLNYLKQQTMLSSLFTMRSLLHLTAPGSGDSVDTSNSIICLEKVLNYIAE